MFNKDKKKLNGYPSPLASNEDKATNEYGLEYFRAMYYEWHNNADVYFRDIKMRYVKNGALFLLSLSLLMLLLTEWLIKIMT